MDDNLRQLAPSEALPRPAARQGRHAVSKLLALLAVYLALIVLPLAVAAAQGLPRRAWTDELATGLALAAFAMLLAEFALSGRHRALSAQVGMDTVMRFHQYTGVVALALLLVHPVLYSYTTPPGADRALAVQLPLWGTLSGFAALALLVIVVAFAWFRDQLPFRYEAWRASHGAAALGVAAFGAHHAIDTGRHAQSGMAWFWIATVLLALAALAWAYLVKPLGQSRRAWRLASVARDGEQMWRLVIEPAGAQRGFTFHAGQFVWLKFHRALGRLTEHPFSIASAPAGLPRLEFLVREAGDFTSRVGELAPGTPAYVDGPYGNFTLEGRAGEHLLLVAGGAGIAPMLSLLRHLAAGGDPRAVTLVYADRHEGQLAARAELEALASSGRLALHIVLAEPPVGWRGLTGRIDRDNLARCLPPGGAARCLAFVCGPPAMIDAAERALAELGVPLTQVVSERFRYTTGIATPRERLTRAVLAAVTAVIVLASAGFALR